MERTPERYGLAGTPASLRQPAAGAKHRVRSGILVAALLMLCSAPARGAEVKVAIDRESEICHVTGGFDVAVPPAVAWAVLRDYDDIPRFVTSMVSSRSEQRAGRLVVHQVARAGFLMFHRDVHVELDVVEQPMEQIVFEDRLLRDFTFYGGSWTLAGDSTGCRVDYALGAEPRGPLARALCRGALKKTAEELLGQVRQEMLRRSLAHKAPEPAEPVRGR